MPNYNNKLLNNLRLLMLRRSPPKAKIHLPSNLVKEARVTGADKKEKLEKSLSRPRLHLMIDLQERAVERSSPERSLLMMPALNDRDQKLKLTLLMS